MSERYILPVNGAWMLYSPLDGEGSLSQVFVTKSLSQLTRLRLAQITIREFPRVPFLHHAPNASTTPVPSRMIQRDFVVTNDAVVEVGDVEGAVRAELEIDGVEPEVVAGEEVGLLVGLRGGAGEGDEVVIDLRGDGVADEHVIVPLSAPDAAVDVEGTADAGGAVGMLAHDGAEAEGVGLFPELRIGRATNELVDGRAMAVSGIEISP